MIIAWFSCGATSAVACKIALSLYDDVHIYYIETGSGHPDNTRFLADCEKWYNQSIHIIRSDKYTCVSDVLRKGYINGAHGAACTLELKKKVRYKLEKELQHWDGQVWGFDYDGDMRTVDTLVKQLRKKMILTEWQKLIKHLHIIVGRKGLVYGS